MSTKKVKKVEAASDPKKVIASLKGQVTKLKKLLVSREELIANANFLKEEFEEYIEKIKSEFKSAYETVRSENRNLILRIERLEKENARLEQENKHKSFSIIKWLFN